MVYLEVNMLKMDDKEKIKSTQVLKIFENMSYGDNYENTNKAIAWMQSKNNIFAYVEKTNESPNGTSTKFENCITGEIISTIFIPEIDTIKHIVSKSNEKTKWIDTKGFERSKMLNKLAAEIEKNAEMFSQIEIVTRGILAKDTKKVVPLLAEYFYYYSGFATRFSQENPSWKPSGISAAVISNENSISNIGLVLAPALAAGYNVILQVGTKIVPSAILILELAKKAGIPQDVIRLIPSDDGELLPYLGSDDVSVLSLLVDLENEKYRGINNLNKKILALSSHKTPIIIFDSADLDSACESIVDSVWGYHGLLPWSANTILVQENIYSTFLYKLKTKMKSLKVGLGHDKMADVSYPGENARAQLANLIKLAKEQGIEVFHVDEGPSNWTPTLFIGGRIQTKKNVNSDGREANVATILPFRSIDEAVNLANNSRQGIGATVWSENIGIVNEVTKKLNVTNIWINSSYGVSAADVTFSPIKESGFGYFGGKEGFYEYVEIVSSKPGVQMQNIEVPILNNSITSAINAAKKAQESWYKISKLNKRKIFQQFAEYIEGDKKQLSGVLTEKWLETWISTIYECITDTYNHSYSSSHSGYNLITTRNARGVIVIEVKKDLDTHNIKLILSALFEGNTLLLIDESSAQFFYTALGKKLPSGVFSVLPYNLATVKTVSAHRDINVYIGSNDVNPVFGLLPIQDVKMYTNVTDSWNDVFRKVTFAKNIWSDIGKSNTCSLGIY